MHCDKGHTVVTRATATGAEDMAIPLDPPGQGAIKEQGDRDEVGEELVQSTVCRTTVHQRTPRHTVESPYDRRNPIPKGHGLEDGTRKGNPRERVLRSLCTLRRGDDERLRNERYEIINDKAPVDIG